MKENLEKDIFQYGLLISVSYQFYQVLISFIPVVNIFMALLNIFLTMIIFFLYLLTQKKGAHYTILIVLHIMALTVFTFFWKNYGGMAGTVPSFYCVYIAFITVCSHGATRWIILISTSVVLTVYFLFPEFLGMASSFEPKNISVLQKNIEYLIVAGLIIAFTVYLKEKFMSYREAVSKRYQQLDQIAETLHAQNQELSLRQEETQAINDNLEAMVDDRAREVETKNQELAEYAFINAHMLRGPLCRIIGLINLMEKEPEKYPAHQLYQLKSIAQEIDHQIKEINSVVS